MLDLSRSSCLGEALRDGMLTFKTNVALIEADRHREREQITYTELRRRAERVAAELTAHGFAAGDRCAILMSNQSKWVICALGALWAGAVLVPLDYKLTPAEQRSLLDHAKPKALFTEYPVWRPLLAELSGTGTLETTRVVVAEAPDKAELGKALRYEHLEGGAFRFVPRAREDVAAIVYSSGTGGRPKGCMLTHHNYLSQAEVLGRLFPMKEEDRYFSILPTNHAIDFMCGFVLPLLFGGAVVHQRTLRPELLMPTMRQYGVSHMALVPRILKALETKIEEQLEEQPRVARDLVRGLARLNELATQRKPSHLLSRSLLKPLHDKLGGKLRLIFAGGAFVERANAEYFYRLGLPVVIGYGMTEAGTVITVNDLAPFRGDTVGVAVEGTEVEIRDAGPDGVGEVWVRGPTVMAGYLDDPELTREVLVDGWLRTGDLGVVDASLHLKLMGRARNMIVTAGGKNVYPEDIESTFMALDEVEEQCVMAASFVWPSGSLVGDELLLVVRAKADVEVAGALLPRVAALNAKLSEYKRIAGVVVAQKEFPRTASQKIKREALAQALRETGAREALVQRLGAAAARG